MRARERPPAFTHSRRSASSSFVERVAGGEEQHDVEVLERLLVDPPAVLLLDRELRRAAESLAVRLQRGLTALRTFLSGSLGEPPARHVEPVLRADLLEHLLGGCDRAVDEPAAVRDEQQALVLAGFGVAVAGRCKGGRAQQRSASEHCDASYASGTFRDGKVDCRRRVKRDHGAEIAQTAACYSCTEADHVLASRRRACGRRRRYAGGECGQFAQDRSGCSRPRVGGQVPSAASMRSEPNTSPSAFTASITPSVKKHDLIARHEAGRSVRGTLRPA